MNIPIKDPEGENRMDGYPIKSILFVLLVFLLILYVVL